ncbi:maestro heat-like repeat family member 5 [Paroedura picta]|uniref:maestro heat-like repeat family member 5 n=1 Tax=Paroedura picta TaxID=143630 RepID=UPI004055A145
MMSEEQAPVKPVPIHAWGEKGGPSITSADEASKPLGEILASALSLWAGDEVTEREKEALDYVSSFVQKNEQEDAEERLKFMDQMDILCNSHSTEDFNFYTSELAADVVKLLIRWTASSKTQEREKATKKMAEICQGIQGREEATEFPAVGQLLGCLTLCCSDPSEEVTRWAAEGLNYLCSFILRHRCQAMANQQESKEFLQREWEQEDTQWVTWLSDPSHVTMFFKKYLSPEELTDFLTVAIGGMDDNNLCNTPAAICIVKAILRDPTLTLGQVSTLVVFIHDHVDSITDVLAQQEVLRTLTFMGKNYMTEVVYMLLNCSPQCDSAAITMWKILVCFSDLAEEVLIHLLACLQGQPLRANVPEEETALLRFAATRVLHELLQQPLPAFKEEVKDCWEKLCLALIFWISFIFQRRVWTWKNIRNHIGRNMEPPSSSLARSTASTLRVVLRNVDNGNEGLLAKKMVLWELLSRAETFHQGVSLFTRAIVRSHPREIKWMVEHVMAVLDDPDESEHITAMALFAELLQSSDIVMVRDRDVLRHLSRQLVAPKAVLRSLALDGMLHLADNPDQVTKLLILVPEVLKRFQEPDREMTLKALRLVKLLSCYLEGVRDASLVEEVATQVLPLFDDESHKVRSLAICLFGNILGTGANPHRRQMKYYALQSLVPLLMHLHDRSPIVIAACWDALSKVAMILNYRKLQPLILNRDKWSICLVIAKSYRKVPQCHFLSNCIKNLKSPQTSIREVAIRLTGLAAQETKSKRKLEVICKALNELQCDPKPSVSCLAVQTMKILEAVHDEIPTGCNVRALVYRVCRPCMR